MVSIFHIEPAPDPVTRKRMILYQVIGIPVVLVLWLIVCAALLGWLPMKVGNAAGVAEICAGPFLVRKFHLLRTQRS